MIEYISYYTRPLIRANRTKLFVFGDNACRTGLGGQAGEARFEPNTIGIATKWAPTMVESAFFNDGDEGAWALVNKDLARVTEALNAGRIVVVPHDGVGTGLSQMPKRCPRLLAHINSILFPEETP